MITFEITKKFEVRPEDINDLMTTALEGGINYWCSHVQVLNCPSKWQYASDVIALDGRLKIYDAETSDTWELTLEKFIAGLKRVCEEDDVESIEDLMQSHDAGTADRIIQYALFNEQVFA